MRPPILLMQEVKWYSVVGLLFQMLRTGWAPAHMFAGCATLRSVVQGSLS